MIKARDLPQDSPVVHGWAQILGISNNNVESVLPEMTGVFTLYQEVTQTTEKLKTQQRAIILRYLPRIGQALYQLHWGNPWNHVRQYLDEATMVALESAAHAFEEEGFAEVELEEDSISSLLRETEELISQVMNSNELSSDLKAFLIDQLEQIRLALLRYKLYGARGLRKALVQITGAYFCSGLDFRKHIRRESKQNEVVGRFWSIAARFSDLVTLATAAAPIAPPLLEAAKNALLTAAR